MAVHHKLQHSSARVLVASNLNAAKAVHDGLIYEFCSAVADFDQADLLLPPAPPRGLARAGAEFLRPAISKTRRFLGLPRSPIITTTKVNRDYEIFLYVCSFVEGLADLDRFQGWRSRCKKAVAFVPETWTNMLERQRAHLKLLDQFDHVFLSVRSSIPNVQRYTRTPCSFLPLGSNCLLASPFPSPPKRTIDVYSIGRRSPAAHLQLINLFSEGKIFYVYDALRPLATKDWYESRLLTMNMIKRSHFFITYDLTVGSALKAMEAGNEQTIPLRYFEGAAGGAVLLGTKPRCAEFDELFDWSDAVIEMPAEPSEIEQFLNRLKAQPERMERVSRENVVQCLRRHDWAYRWEQILNTIGAAPSSELLARKALLARIADSTARPHLRAATIGP